MLGKRASPALPAISRLLVDPATTDELTSTYFDTPDFQLHYNGASLRVRVVGEKRLQTLKLDGAIAAGFFEREEFEGPVAGNSPDLDSLKELLPQKKTAPGFYRQTDWHRSFSRCLLPASNVRPLCFACRQTPEMDMANDIHVIKTEGC